MTAGTSPAKNVLINRHVVRTSERWKHAKRCPRKTVGVFFFFWQQETLNFLRACPDKTPPEGGQSTKTGPTLRPNRRTRVVNITEQINTHLSNNYMSGTVTIRENVKRESEAGTRLKSGWAMRSAGAFRSRNCTLRDPRRNRVKLNNVQSRKPFCKTIPGKTKTDNRPGRVWL